jgi:hypothetical protein
MDFDAFKKQKQAKNDALKEASVANARPMANGSESTWIEGLGPASAPNPKVKGFILGRYKKQRHDPKALERPDGYETMTAHTTAGVVRRVKCCNEKAPFDVAIVQCHGCKTYWHPQCVLEQYAGMCCEGRAMLLALPPRLRPEAEIEKEKKKAGIKRVKGIQKY